MSVIKKTVAAHSATVINTARYACLGTRHRNACTSAIAQAGTGFQARSSRK
ncbi:hypothetical protein PTE30175_01978 [Pandoraea terrae]|uniref:Uncharacterized protein n=1 Tax=Pandoraea terrae TaxID=1537710 RepID=A0A5E4UHL2_9BURK|nr:hypothetical protein PTE30175_01978 [Pandoraea terrae]